MSSNDLNSLIGYWVLDCAPENAHEIGIIHLRFTSAGLLQEGYENEARNYVLSFKYWIEGDAIATICPPNPRNEVTPFSIDNNGNLILSDGGYENTWARTEKKDFFDSKSIWDPGILFERQVDYMSLLDSEPYDYQIKRALFLGIPPQILINTVVLWKCWKYGRSRFASFHLEDFDHILNRDVLIDDEDNEDRTLLSYLAEDGLTDAVKSAVEYGANINHADLYGNTPLDYAVWKGRVETVRLMVALGGIEGKAFSSS